MNGVAVAKLAQRRRLRDLCDDAERAEEEFVLGLQIRLHLISRDLLAGRATRLYFVREPAGGAIKIGVANDVQARMENLQISTPHELELLVSVPATTGVEAFLHRALVEWRIRGEWFSPHPRVLATIGLLSCGADFEDDFAEQGETASPHDTLAMVTAVVEEARAAFRGEAESPRGETVG